MIQGRPAGDWISLILLLIVVVGFVLAYLLLFVRDRHNPVTICQRADMTLEFLGFLGFVGIVLAYVDLGPDWLRGLLAVVGAPIMVSVFIFSLAPARKTARARATTLQVLIVGIGIGLCAVTWLMDGAQPEADHRMIIVGFTAGTALGWGILAYKKFFIPDNGMVRVQIVQVVIEEE